MCVQVGYYRRFSSTMLYLAMLIKLGDRGEWWIKKTVFTFYVQEGLRFKLCKNI